MDLPDISPQHSPVPIAVRVAFATTSLTTPQVEHQSSEVNDRLVHDVARKTSRRFKDVGKAVEDTGLSDSSLQAMLLVLGVGQASHNNLESISMFRGIGREQLCDIYVWVIAGCIVGAQGLKQDRVVVRSTQFIASFKLTE